MPRADDQEPLIRDRQPPNLLNSRTRIASLTLQSTANPHVHKDHPVALDLLKQAVQITRPWLDEVRAELEQHQHHMSRSTSHPQRREIPGFRSHLLSELPKLVPLVAKYVAMSKDRKSDGKRLEFLQVLLGVLGGKVLGAEREIGRLERMFARGGGRGRGLRERGSERKRSSVSEGEESEWYGEMEERRGGARDEYYRGEVGDGEGVDGQRRERRRRRRRRSDVEDERSSHHEERREHRGRRESRTITTHDREAPTAQDEAQPRGPNFNQMTPEERLKAKEKTLARHKERKAQEEQQATKTSPVRKSTSSRKSASSGTTESIPRFPPLPIGVHAPRDGDKETVPG